MALTNAEKQRRYRKRDAYPTRRAEYLKKEKDHYEKSKETGQRKLVCDMTSRKHRSMKKQWRKQKQGIRKRKKDHLKQLENMLSPPASPEDVNVRVQPSRQYLQGVNQRRRIKIKQEMYISSLERELKIAERKADMYRKRYQRTKKGPDTPRSKTKNLLRNWKHKSSKTVRKTLIFHHALLDQMSASYKNKRNKEMVSGILAGQIVRKYKCLTYLRDQIKVEVKRGRTIKTGTVLRSRSQKDVESFFERDDVSRITTGQKRTVTVNKEKKQKRLLCDTLKNLYRKYVSESMCQEPISFTTFWVIRPTEKDRDTKMFVSRPKPCSDQGP